MAVWTHGRWIVKPGREDESLAALGGVAAAVQKEMDVPRPTVLRDRDQPNRFLTFGRWESIEAIERFREVALPKIAEMQDLLEGFEIFTLDEVGPE
jgi:quinol monooxygenase YgiN